jgi:hypothetical protein
MFWKKKKDLSSRLSGWLETGGSLQDMLGRNQTKFGRNARLNWSAGFGLTGSTTWAMFGENDAATRALDVYAIHCCWELESNEDPRAPGERSTAAGRRLLAEYNAEFRLKGV